jgi:hypothetical protein
LLANVTTERLQIVIWKWRSPHKLHLVFNYSSEAVNRLSSEISRNLSLPHDIVCVTDDPVHLNSNIRTVPLWPDARHLGGCWTRLKAFAPEMRELIGPRFVWIDLDTIVTGSLDPLFSRTEDAVFLGSDPKPGTPYNGSMVMMTAGARAEVWSTFDPDRSPALTRNLGLIGTDQAWFAYVLGRNEAVWLPDSGAMCSADCVPDLPSHARIVFFPGPSKPHMSTTWKAAPWVTRYVPDLRSPSLRRQD